MAGSEGIVLALIPAQEARHAALLAEGWEAVLAAGEHLVRIGLMPDVPDNLVLRGVEDVVQRDRELDGAQAGTEVSTGPGDRVDQRGPDLHRQLLKLTVRELFQVGGRVDA